MDILLMVLDQDPVRPSLLNPKVDRNLELICLKCLQKQPDLRYASAEALARDLEAFLAGEPLSVQSVKLFDVFNHMLRDTPNAVVLENWGLLWMWHSLALLIACVLTNVLYWYREDVWLWIREHVLRRNVDLIGQPSDIDGIRVLFFLAVGRRIGRSPRAGIAARGVFWISAGRRVVRPRRRHPAPAEQAHHDARLAWLTRERNRRSSRWGGSGSSRITPTTARIC
jgi:hypothetical protein